MSANSPLGFVSHAYIVPVYGFFPKALSKALRRELYLRQRKCKALTDQWMKHLFKAAICAVTAAVPCCKRCLWSVSQRYQQSKAVSGFQFPNLNVSPIKYFAATQWIQRGNKTPLNSSKSVESNELDWIGVGGQEMHIYRWIRYMDTLKLDPRKHLRCSRRTLQCLAATARHKFPQTLQWQPAKHCHTNPSNERFQPRLLSKDCCYSVKAQRHYLFRKSAWNSLGATVWCFPVTNNTTLPIRELGYYSEGC